MKKQVPVNPAENRTGGLNWLAVVTALTVTCYLTSNVMAVKVVEFGGSAWFDAGTITFPLAYMLGDVLTEIWGFKTARRVVFLTFLCNIFFIAFTSLGVLLPSPEYAADTVEAYKLIFTVTPRILVASLIAFLIGEVANAWIMVIVKKLTKGKYLFIRTILSSMVGHGLDTAIFVVIAFAGAVPIKDVVSMIIIQYLFKLGVEAIFATPIAYGAIAFLKRKVAPPTE